MPCSSKATGAVRCAPSDADAEFRRGLIVLSPDAVPAVEAKVTVVVCAKTWACRLTGELPIQMHMDEIASTTIVTALFKTGPPKSDSDFLEQLECHLSLSRSHVFAHCTIGIYGLHCRRFHKSGNFVPSHRPFEVPNRTSVASASHTRQVVLQVSPVCGYRTC